MIYCFRDKKTGMATEKHWTVAELEKRTRQDGSFVDNDGVIWDRDYETELGVVSGCSNWPMKSDAAGVHPSQIKEASENAARKGVPTRFDSQTGQAIFESRGHRQKYLKAHGLRDRNAGYGD